MDANDTKWIEVPADAYGYRAPRWTNQIKNMPEESISDFASCNMYILDDVLRGPNDQGGGSPGMVQHEFVCNEINDLFSNVFTDWKVHSVRFQRGQREEDFVQHFATELEQYTPRDLVAFYYHGKACIKDDEYTWRFRGPGPRTINAHDFICQVNKSRPDCYFILDCFVPTHFTKSWKRTNGMTEFSVTGHQMRNDHGQPINGPENFTETLCRAIRDIANVPRGRRMRPTIHHIIGMDKIKCSDPLRLWTAHPNRKKRDQRVWRFFVDIQRLKETGRFELRKCQVTGRRTGDGEFDDESEVEDDGENGQERRGRGAGDEGGRRRGNNENDDSGLESDDDNDDGGAGGGGGVANALNFDDDSDDQGARRPERNDTGIRRTARSPRPDGQRPRRRRSPTASSERKIKRSRSSSPFFDLEGRGRLGSERSVKREPSGSPEIEIVDIRPIRGFIDLSSVDDVVDLTQDDGAEESLFIPLD